MKHIFYILSLTVLAIIMPISVFSQKYTVKGRVVSNNSVYKKGDNSHILDFDISDNRLSCFDNISLEEVLEGGLVTFVYYGQHKNYQRRIFHKAIYITQKRHQIRYRNQLCQPSTTCNKVSILSATKSCYKKIYARLHHTTNLQGTKKLTASLMVSMQKGYGRPYTDGQIAPTMGCYHRQTTHY